MTDHVVIDGHECGCVVSARDINGVGVLYQGLVELPDGRCITGSYHRLAHNARVSAWWAAQRIWQATGPSS